MDDELQEKYLAHVVRNREGKCNAHVLEEHLDSVAGKAGIFACTFGSSDWAELLGLWHDLGKFHPAWQAYLRRETGCDADAHLENQR